jgi:hypothetical protein
VKTKAIWIVGWRAIVSVHPEMAISADFRVGQKF